MSYSIAFWLVTIFLGMAAFQSIFAIWFAWTMRAVKPYQDRSDHHWPRVSILMALRGADPCLNETLQGLIDMDYPSFDLRVIVDSEPDPAWKVVNHFIERSEATNVTVSSIRERLTSCGLQCCAFAQAAHELPPETEVVVTVDGDLRAHSTLLRSLVAPFADPQVGLTFGNRWFMPPDLRWGSWVRYLWNTAAVVPMHLFGIPWGGCFAIRRSALDGSGLAESWQKVMVHDAPAKALLEPKGLKVKFVPSLMIGISDPCSLSFSHDFIKRQMLWTRLYHPNFAPVLLHAILTSAMTILLLGLGLVSCLALDLPTLLVAWGGLLSYLIWLGLLVALIDHSVRHVFHVRGSNAHRYPLSAWLRLPGAILLTQGVYLSSILLATFRNRVLWRGIEYEIRQAYDVKRLNDVVFQQEMDGVSL